MRAKKLWIDCFRLPDISAGNIHHEKRPSQTNLWKDILRRHRAACTVKKEWPKVGPLKRALPHSEKTIRCLKINIGTM
jgi:hypothetical protein